MNSSDVLLVLLLLASASIVAASIYLFGMVAAILSPATMVVSYLLLSKLYKVT